MQNTSLVCRITPFNTDPEESSWDKPFRAKIPARPDHFVCNLDTAICDYNIKRVVVGLRESDRSQNLNFTKQKLAVERRLKKYNLEIVDIIPHIGSGRVYGPLGESIPRPDLEKLADIAIRENAVIFMEDISRYLRPSQYTKYKQWIRLKEKELIRLKQLTKSVLLISGTDPLAPPKEVRRQQTLRGRIVPKGQKRVKYSKKRRDRLLFKIIDMRTEGNTLKKISLDMKVPIPTISKWLKAWKEDIENEYAYGESDCTKTGKNKGNNVLTSKNPKNGHFPIKKTNKMRVNNDSK